MTGEIYIISHTLTIVALCLNDNSYVIERQNTGHIRFQQTFCELFVKFTTAYFVKCINIYFVVDFIKVTWPMSDPCQEPICTYQHHDNVLFQCQSLTYWCFIYRNTLILSQQPISGRIRPENILKHRIRLGSTRPETIFWLIVEFGMCKTWNHFKTFYIIWDVWPKTILHFGI